jgi:hypothetical protein
VRREVKKEFKKKQLTRKQLEKKLEELRDLADEIVGEENEK